MLICPICGKVNPADARNCDVCGAPLAGAEKAHSMPPVYSPASAYASPQGDGSGAFSGPLCPVCRRPNRSASVFCAHCGARLRPDTGAPAYALPHIGAAPASAPSQPLDLPITVPADVTGNIPTGTVLKRRYRVLRKVAQGGMGAVYESTDVNGTQGNRWAIKEISPAALPAGERTQAVMDFRREAQMLASLHHPNLILVEETFEEMGKHFLVMEFVPGRTLLNILDNNGAPLGEERVLVWARQLADVIQYLHAQDPPIIYRDLKPANVMQVEGTERIKLIDFGIARMHKVGKAQDTEAFGTAGYAPPEQYGKGQTDQRSDIYALAAMLHHLLTNRDPSLNPFNWLPIRRYNPNVSDRVDSAIMNALNLDPQKRFQSIEAFARALGVDLPKAQKPKPAAALQVYTPPPAPATQPVQAPITFNNGSSKTGVATPAAASTTNGQDESKSRTGTAAPRKKYQGKAQEPLIPMPVPVAPTPVYPTVFDAAPIAAGNWKQDNHNGQAASTAAPSAPAKQAEAVPVAMPRIPVAAQVAAASVAAVPVIASAPVRQPTADIVTPTEQTAPPRNRTSASAPTKKSGPLPQVAIPTKPREQVAEVKPPRVTNGHVNLAPALVVSDRLLDLGDSNAGRKPVQRVQLHSVGGERVEGTVLASQPWIAYNPAHFKGNAVTLEVKVKRSQLRFSRQELQVPNLFAIIWARTRRILPFIGCWFWLLLLVASSLGRVLLWGLAGTVGALMVAEALLWLWSLHVRLLVPAERLNTGRLWVKSSGGDQQIDVKVMARPSWIRRGIGWTMALVLLTAELSGVAWLVLTLVGVQLSVSLPVL